MKVIDWFFKSFGSRSDKIFLCCLSVLLLILGYFIGYWTAEEKRPVPIVFEGNNTRPQILSEADIEKLNSLAQQTDMPANPVAIVASAKTEKSTTTIVPASTDSASFVASVSGEKYYYLTCSEVKRIKEENKIFFKAEQEAIDAGYSASSCILKSRQ